MRSVAIPRISGHKNSDLEWIKYTSKIVSCRAVSKSCRSRVEVVSNAIEHVSAEGWVLENLALTVVKSNDSLQLHHKTIIRERDSSQNFSVFCTKLILDLSLP
jgi:hypothetical protein